MIHLEESIRTGTKRRNNRFPRVPDSYSVQVSLELLGFEEVTYKKMESFGKSLGNCYCLGDYTSTLGTHWIRFQVVKDKEWARFFLRTDDAAVPGAVTASNGNFTIIYNGDKRSHQRFDDWYEFLKIVDDWLDDSSK